MLKAFNLALHTWEPPNAPKSSSSFLRMTWATGNSTAPKWYTLQSSSSKANQKTTR